MPSTGDTLLDKVASSIIALEGRREARTGLQFAPNVHAVSSMLNDNNAGFVAVSSSAIDPACFLGGYSASEQTGFLQRARQSTLIRRCIVTGVLLPVIGTVQ